MKMKNLELCLQLFAELTDGDTTQFTGENQVAAAPEATGEETASAAGMQTVEEEFAQLIKGKYKDAYNKRVQETLQKRLKDNKALSERLEALQTAVAALPTREDRAANQQRLWADQAAHTAAIYPGFDLGKELQNPTFRTLISCDVPVQTAYEVLHKDRLLPAAMAHTAYTVEQKLCNSLAAMGSRPPESAMGAHSANQVRNDVSQMTPAERAAIIHRVRKGETIRF